MNARLKHILGRNIRRLSSRWQEISPKLGRGRGRRPPGVLGTRPGRGRGRPSPGVLGKLWQPMVILVVLAVVAYGVNTVRHMSEHISHPPVTSTIPATVIQINPKNVIYEAFGDLGTGGRVTYADLDSRPIEVTLTSLPWSISETTMSPSATLSLVMQVDGDAAGCRILVDGKVRDEHLVSHPSAAVACTVTAA